MAIADYSMSMMVCDARVVLTWGGEGLFSTSALLGDGTSRPTFVSQVFYTVEEKSEPMPASLCLATLITIVYCAIRRKNVKDIHFAASSIRKNGRGEKKKNKVWPFCLYLFVFFASPFFARPFLFSVGCCFIVSLFCFVLFCFFCC